MVKNLTVISPHLFSLAAFQRSLRRYIVYESRLKKIETIAGADVSYQGDYAYAALCVFTRSLQLIEKCVVREKITFPYIPGYLLFREGPPLLKALSRIKVNPDCFLFDGNGILHPYTMGLATFLGIVLQKPTIGCAKNLFLGKHKPLALKRGSVSFITYQKRRLGAAVRTRRGIKAVYVSVGWGVSLKQAIALVVASSSCRIPEPLRIAHHYAKKRAKDG